MQAELCRNDRMAACGSRPRRTARCRVESEIVRCVAWRPGPVVAHACSGRQAVADLQHELDSLQHTSSQFGECPAGGAGTATRSCRLNRFRRGRSKRGPTAAAQHELWTEIDQARHQHSSQRICSGDARLACGAAETARPEASQGEGDFSHRCEPAGSRSAAAAGPGLGGRRGCGALPGIPRRSCCRLKDLRI